MEDQNLMIEGVEYSPIEHKPGKSNKMIGRLAMMAAAFGGMGGYGGSGYSRSMPNVNIVDEYKLIVQKKSDLSRVERDMVVRAFLRAYQPVEK